MKSDSHRTWCCALLVYAWSTLCSLRPQFFNHNLIFLDIDECLRPGACGVNAVCQNFPGNYTCACEAGYTGNAFNLVCEFITLQIPYIFIDM